MGRPLALLLPLSLGCSDRPKGEAGDSGDTTGGTPAITLYGYAKAASTGGPLVGARAWSVAAPGRVAVSDGAGEWSLRADDTAWLHLRSEADGMLPMDAWIDPQEITDPAWPYPYTLGSADDLDGLAASFGEGPSAPGTAVLFVDAMDPRMRDLAGAVVEVDGPHSAPWREHAPGEWDNEPLTTEDRFDLLYFNVPAGPLQLRATDPLGEPCEVPPDIVIEASTIAQVSVYCAAESTAPPAERGAPRSR
jgi:hypothetical protein